jgi:hypothetical protein
MQQSHILFLSLQCISRMWESLFPLFLGQRNWKLLLRERNKRLVSNFHLITRTRDSAIYLNDETLVNFAPKKKETLIMNSITIVSTTGPTGRRA